MITQKPILFFLILLGLGVLTAQPSLASPKAQQPCITTRAAIDIGSGTTKLLVAKVNTCRQKIINILRKESQAVRYKKDIKANGGKLSDTIQTEGIAVLQKFATLAEQAPIQAVATEAMREASNSQAFLRKIKESINLPVRIIDQKLEAELGFRAATSNSPEKAEMFFVWDIGGGSMQITGLVDGKLKIYTNKIGSVTAKDTLLASQKKQSDSPNPVTKHEAKRAIAKMRKNALHDLPSWLKQEAQNRKIIGIGGVHFYNTCVHIEDKAKGCQFFRSELTNAIYKKLVGKTDQELGGGKYVDEAVSNPILVVSFMQALGLFAVKTADINIANGVVISNRFYEKNIEFKK